MGPMLLGEAINSFAAFTLSVTLFAVFCSSLHPQDLIINCVAINFLGSADTEYPDQEMANRAVKNFRKVIKSYAGNVVEVESCGRICAETVSSWGLWSLRVLGV